jgi:hypothetical protein
MKILRELKSIPRIFKTVFIVVFVMAIAATLGFIYELNNSNQKGNSNSILDSKVMDLSGKLMTEQKRYDTLFEAVLYNNHDDITNTEVLLCSKQSADYSNISRGVDITSSTELDKLNNSPEGVAFGRCVTSADSSYMSDFIQKSINSVVHYGNLEDIKLETVRQ